MIRMSNNTNVLEDEYVFELNDKQKKMSDELFKQVHKNMSRMNRKQAGSGIEKYRSSMRAFCDFVAKEYRMRNLRNISNKHLAGFGQHRQNQGIKDVKTELSAVRKFHATLDKPRYKELETDNSKLGIEKRQTVKDGQNIVDRAWTDKEFKEAVEVAKSYGHQDIANAFEIARYGGLRINEVTALTKSQIRNGLKNGYFTVTHTKGNIQRMSYVETKEYQEALQKALKHAKFERIFQSHGKTHKQAKTRIQNLIYRHREKWSDVKQTNEREVDNQTFRVRQTLNFHGLRHAYAREQYRKYLGRGMTKKQARKEVAIKLGHNRDEVTKVYL